MPLGRWLLALVIFVAGCDEGNLLAVDLRTDYVPGAEFFRVRVELVPEEGRGRAVETPVITSDDFLGGQRVGEIDGLAPGLTRLRVDLIDETGASIASRAVVVDVGGSLGVTVVMTRDCAEVTCPDPRGDPALEACLAGRCVDPRCTDENPSACGAAECGADTDCPAPSGACAEARCVRGVCLEVAAAMCGASEYCNPDTGCTPLPVAPSDGGTDGDPGDGDAGAVPPAVVSMTRLTTATEFSYVTLEVDWSRRLAYLGSRENGVCLTVVDFTDELAPSILGTFNASSTPPMPGNRCLGLALQNDSRLFVSAEETGSVASFDLGDPRALAFTRIDTVAVNRARALALAPDGGAVVAGYRGGARRLPIDASGSFLTPEDVSLGCELDGIAPFGGHALGGCWPNGEPIHLMDFAAGASIAMYDMDNGGTSGLWGAAISDDGRNAFVGGWVSAFFDTDPTAGTARLTSRFDNMSHYRDATFVEDGALRQLWAPLANVRRVEVWDVSDIDAPTLTHDLAIPLDNRELYAIEVDPVSRRALVASNDGWLIVLDVDLMPAAARTPVTF